MKKNLLILVLFVCVTNAAFAQTLKGTYTLTSVATGKCLDGNETNLYPFPPNNGDHQKWIIKQMGATQGRKVYRLTSVATGKCLDYNGERLYPRGPDDSRTQLWIVDPVNNCADCFTLTHLPTGKRLDGDAESLYPFDPNEGNHQKWRIVPAVPAPARPAVSPAITGGLATENTLSVGSNFTTKAIRFSDWSKWERCGFGEYRWRWGANTLSSDFPKFIDVYYEVKNTRKSAVKASAGVRMCKDPQSSSKYNHQFTLEAGQSGEYKVAVLNCGTADAPNVIKPYVYELIRID